LAEIAAAKKANGKGTRVGNNPPAKSKIESECGPEAA
jgi:hypothetical protein